MQNQFLLLEDVRKLGKKGDLVKTKPGYARNFLVPQKMAVVASKQTLRMRERLQAERATQAVHDMKEAEELAKIIEGKTLSVNVKIDPAGHLYGSITATDIIKLFEEQGITVERQFVVLPQPIKKTGLHKVDLRLKEGVPTFIYVKVIGEGIEQEAGRGMISAEDEESSGDEEIPLA